MSIFQKSNRRNPLLGEENSPFNPYIENILCVPSPSPSIFARKMSMNATEVAKCTPS